MDKTKTLKEIFEKEVIPAFEKEFKVDNRMAVPKPVKVTINIGIGRDHKDEKVRNEVTEILTTITGQKPVYTRAKKSIAEFGIREGDIVGIKVTLRKRRMWDFLDRLVKIVLPRVKDFRGISPTAFDNHGNYTLGLLEYLIFPEIDPAKVVKVKGASVAITFSKSTQKEIKYIMEKLGFIFKE